MSDASHSGSDAGSPCPGEGGDGSVSRSALGTEVIGCHRFQETYEAFVEAFSDYLIEVTMSPAKLRRMFRRRSADLSRSLGLFEGRRMVGFVLNGLRQRNGSTWGYDVGTGLSPEFRGKGFARRLLEENLALLRKEGLRAYILEVLTENHPAIKLYESLGFTTRRRLRCLRLPVLARIPTRPRSGDLRLRECRLAQAPWSILRPQRLYLPSWQNDMEHLARETNGATSAETEGSRANSLGTEDPVVILAEKAPTGEPLGFLVCEADGGEILDFGIAKAGTEDEVLAAFLLDLRRRQLASGSEGPVQILNVDSTAEKALGLLSRLGFEPYVDQYEMERRL